MERVIRSWTVRAGLLAVTLVGAAALLSGCSGKVAEADPKDPAQPSLALTVQTVHPRRETLEISYTAPGYVEAWARVPIVAKANGYLRSFGTDTRGQPIDIGSRIRKGQPLAYLSIPEWVDEKKRREAAVSEKAAMVRDAQASEREAEANVVDRKARVAEARSAVVTARATYDFDATHYRVEYSLLQSQSRPYENVKEAESKMVASQAAIETAKSHVEATEAELQSAIAKRDTAQSMIATARAALARAKADLRYQETLMEYMTVKAPFDGEIVRRNAFPGDFIQDAATGRGQPVLVADETDEVRVFVDLPEADALRIQDGAEATFQIQAYPEVFTGSVTRFASSLDPETRTIRVEIDFDNKENKLYPGMYGYATIALEKHPHVLSVPNAAIDSQGEGEQKFVFTVVKDKVRKMPIVTGFDNGIRTEVLAGLTENDQVLVSNLGDVVDGQVVTASLKEEPAEDVSIRPQPVAPPSPIGAARRGRPRRSRSPANHPAPGE